jgi:hypothetical protein
MSGDMEASGGLQRADVRVVVFNNNNNNNNRPDIIIKNKKDKICVLIDVAIPSDRNVIQE